MRLQWFFGLCIVFNKVEALSRYFGSSDLGKAFTNISESISKGDRLVTFVMGGASIDERLFDQFVQHANTYELSYLVTRLEHNWSSFSLNSSSIVLLDSVDSLEKFNRRILLPATFSSRQTIFVYCRDGSFDKIAQLNGVSRFKTPIVQYEYFIVEEENFIRLLTFVWYLPKQCGRSLVEVNKFNKISHQWQHKKLSIGKFSDFHGCEITFLMTEYYPGFFDEQIDKEMKKVTACRGFNCAIVQDFSTALNYRVRMNVQYDSFILWPEMVSQRKVESLSLCEKHIMDPKNEFLVTRPVFYIEHFITVPPGEEYNEYEKMILPFDEPTWIWIGITFFSAFTTILVLKFAKPAVTNFVIGEDTATPALNVLRAFFGISQIVCPGRSFARYLLMVFILFSLVVRTAYQGKMFEFLQKEMRKPAVTTIEEMIDQNFTFFMMRGFKSVFADLDLVRRGHVIDDYTDAEFFEAYERAFLANSKVASFYKEDMFRLEALPNRTVPPLQLRERLMLDPQAFVFENNHFMFESFDRKLQQYIEADLVNYNTRWWYEKNNPKKLEEFTEPFAVLTLGELEAGFVVCLVPLLLSTVVFFIEWVPTLKDLIVFRFILNKYFEVKDVEQRQNMKLASQIFKARNNE